MKYILILLIFMFVSLHVSAEITTCGEYDLHGHVKLTPKGTLSLKLNYHTESELPIYLGEYSSKDHLALLDAVVEMRVLIESPCTFFCNGKMIKILKYVSPFQNDKIYWFPLENPVHTKSCNQTL